MQTNHKWLYDEKNIIISCIKHVFNNKQIYVYYICILWDRRLIWDNGISAKLVNAIYGWIYCS